MAIVMKQTVVKRRNPASRSAPAIQPERSFPAGEFKTKCLHLLDEVQQSRKPIVITKRGKPVARLVPLEEEKPVIFGRMRGTGVILGDIISPIDERWDAVEGRWDPTEDE